MTSVQARGDPADVRLIEEAPGLPAASEQLECSRAESDVQKPAVSFINKEQA
ncbi:hypothetical protein P343_13675 [Sporolactobacillus laevolacticus DSM 442]|uniref:Uncharacterized protein n=1 Tax=Sporolactobacillus laevolacticus DSM 442 TaxID=1395513 RepID=V6IVP3_9BACL|nr:hypothetical protein P343_13675 [Sporolactobacillus laevolacticus DSM 442]